MELHEQLAPLAGLIGAWRGPATGQYPTIKTFSYTEELTFTNVGKPFLAYQQRTWSPTGQPMHIETGYLRHPAPGIIEFVIALPTGQSEMAEGTVTETDSGVVIELHSRVLNSGTAKTVDSMIREYRLDGDTLNTRLDMAAVGQGMTNHLVSELTRAVD
ncbi:FABP family protein [Flaviflexus huanghaiensis]|uniref:FABP family protein n=1 Tax=Flaviflexus huanghaiensis TaxID=1111473 RepID=UPI0015FA7BC4|nr:FABP family protein [Flaviflexus huanghaiensis]